MPKEFFRFEFTDRVNGNEVKSMLIGYFDPEEIKKKLIGDGLDLEVKKVIASALLKSGNVEFQEIKKLIANATDDEIVNNGQ